MIRFFLGGEGGVDHCERLWQNKHVGVKVL